MSLKQRIARPLRRAQHRIARLLFDRGIDTIDSVSVDELGLGSHMHKYKASPRFYLRRGLSGFRVRSDDVFVDLGSGKGRVVLLAARYPFARVIGVEISERLNEIARANIERRRSRLRCQDVEIIAADLAEYELPDDVTVAYVSNPVDGPLFDAMLANVIASLDRRPRPLRLIYHMPKEHDRVMASGRFALKKLSRGLRVDLPPTLGVYESKSG
jgi:SAM-dependent methyltransferase